LKKKILFVALAMAAILWPGVTKVNFNRITPGMTMDEVNTIFGRPGETLVFWTADNVRYENQRWEGRFGGWATVSFADGCVIETQWFEPTRSLSEEFGSWLDSWWPHRVRE
jgi:hypothetical protein